MNFKEHILELRNRLIIILIFFIIITFVGYGFSEKIYYFLLIPLKQLDSNLQLVYTGLTEAFFTYLKLAVFFAFTLTAPFILWQIYRFINPALYSKERKMVIASFSLIPLLFWAGMMFAYYIVFPLAWRFFLTFEKNPDINLILQAKINEYLSLVIHIMLAFGFAFQLPLILLLLLWSKLIDTQFLIKKRRIAIVIFFIIAAIITPPDVISQLLLAVPMIIMYELTIIYSKKYGKK
jgi:sec-independent protein translocase protein TatC